MATASTSGNQSLPATSRHWPPITTDRPSLLAGTLLAPSGVTQAIPAKQIPARHIVVIE
jgi:hypothetical protein